MWRQWFVILIALVSCACSNPKDAVVPTALDKMGVLKPALDKLTPEERELFAGYATRHTVGAAMGGLFGIKADPIPDGITLGKAIDEQRDFLAKQKQKEAEEKALKEKLKAEQEKAREEMRQAATVTLVSKKIDVERGYGGMVMDESLTITIGLKNTSAKEISGVKGTLTTYDIFGDKLAGFSFSYDKTLKPGEAATWIGGRSVKFGMNSDKDRKLADLPDDKFKAVWEPDMIVFSDGSRLVAPQ